MYRIFDFNKIKITYIKDALKFIYSTKIRRSKYTYPYFGRVRQQRFDIFSVR